MSKFILGQFTWGGRFGGCGVCIFVSPCSSASQQHNHCVFLASCDLSPGVRGEHSHPWGLSSLKASLQEMVWLHCNSSAAFPTFVLTCWAASDPAGIPTPSCIGCLKGKHFETDAVFCTQSLEILHWAFPIATGREMRINRCLWLYHSESCYTAQASLGSLPVTGSAQPSPCWRHVTPEQTQRDLLCPTSLVLLFTLESQGHPLGGRG